MLNLIKQAVRIAPAGKRILQNRAAKKGRWVYLADNGTGNVDAGTGQVYVREPGATDANGNTIGGQIYPVYTGGRNFYVTPGAKVKIALRDGVLKIVDIDDVQSVANNQDPSALNIGRPENRFFIMKNATRGRVFAVGNPSNPSTLIGMKGLLYVDHDGVLQKLDVTRQSTKPDLATYIPAAGLEGLAIVFWRGYDNSLQIYSSTSQAVGSGYDITDYQECIDQSYINEDKPLQAFKLADGQTSIGGTSSDIGEDLRGWLNLAPLAGFPNPVAKNWYIRSTREEIVVERLVVTARLTVAGKMTALDPTPAPPKGKDLSVTITVSDSPYTPDITPDVIYADSSGGAISIDLTGLTEKDNGYSIKNLGTNTVTILGTFDGETNMLLEEKYDAPRISYNGTEWSVL